MRHYFNGFEVWFDLISFFDTQYYIYVILTSIFIIIIILL